MLTAQAFQNDNTINIGIIDSEKLTQPDYGCNITLPESNISQQLTGLLSAGVLLGFAGLCSPSKVEVPILKLDREAIEILQTLFQITSDSRMFVVFGRDSLKDNLLELSSMGFQMIHRANPQVVDSKKVLQLCSGGIDSFLSTVMFLDQGYTVELLHIKGINVDNTDNELMATKKIAERFNLKLHIYDAEWTGIREFGIEHNPHHFAVAPDHNAVPYGRDLLLLVLAGHLANKIEASVIGIANDFESWDRPANPTGRKKQPFACRNELESRLAHKPLLSFLHYFYNPNLQLVSPIVKFSKYALVEFLVKRYPDFINDLCSCFWDNWCGECKKCTNYGILFAQYDNININFKSDPLEIIKLRDLSENDINSLLVWGDALESLLEETKPSE